MKTLQNNFTTPEQSKRLLELGVPADSADCVYTYLGIKILPENIVYSSYDWMVADGDKRLPCWSVGRLIEIWLHCNKFSIDSTSEPITISLLDISESFIDDFIHLLKKAVYSKHIDFSNLEE